MADLGDWNYLIGFGLIFAGLVIAAHPSTPLGRGRGVVVGMLGCFLIGLLWICTFYVISDDLSTAPGLRRPRPEEPAGRHRLHGRRLHLRHALGVIAAPALRCPPSRPEPPVRPPGDGPAVLHIGDNAVENYIHVVLHR